MHARRSPLHRKGQFRCRTSLPRRRVRSAVDPDRSGATRGDVMGCSRGAKRVSVPTRDGGTLPILADGPTVLGLTTPRTGNASLPASPLATLPIRKFGRPTFGMPGSGSRRIQASTGRLPSATGWPTRKSTERQPAISTGGTGWHRLQTPRSGRLAAKVRLAGRLRSRLQRGLSYGVGAVGWGSPAVRVSQRRSTMSSRSAVVAQTGRRTYVRPARNATVASTRGTGVRLSR